ncbi:hypothetical protein MJO29_012764 [Puccinia striiformis f. sp. tritici]|nr:hypothetical protein MJO29_012764 [Puccinia striiformis f. sp. tritici]
MNQLARANRPIRTVKGVTLFQKLYQIKNDDTLKDHIKKKALDKYKQEPKSLQVEAVFNLAKGCNTFLLAGTGYGKSRISEMYFDLIPRGQRAVVLVLNPLDALGENQVLEKELAGYTAINLTKMNFDQDISSAILNGDYNFIYLSPEIYLNSRSFDQIYFSPEFQNRLATIVIDEAHMIYIWGLVESSTSKTNTSVHRRHEDYGSFRPGYGKIGPHLLFRNDKPLLLLSATCRPVAMEAIMKCLKLNENDLSILRGELTRPEIRIIRADMENSLASSLDLIKSFPSANDVPDEEMVPTLVYSGSRNRTLTAMEVFDMARETPGACFVPRGNGIRRFHSCTGDQDKKDVVSDFSAGKVPVISCTMALGLGQNWKRVRMVAHMGRGDPANICQMIGRCGRDGRQGLALMFVEKNRRGGKNSVDQFKRGAPQNDQDRMDALAITPMCLRVAFSMDNLLGYIPLWADDPECIREKERQEQLWGKCLCSNCSPTESNTLLHNLVFANRNNFDNILQGTFQAPGTRNISLKYPAKRPSLRKRKIPEAERHVMDLFKAQLVAECHDYYESTFGSGGPIEATDIFGDKEAEAIVLYLHHINAAQDVRGVIGGECFDGQVQWLYEKISSFKSIQVHTTRPGLQKKARISSAPALLTKSTPVTRQRSKRISDVNRASVTPGSGPCSPENCHQPPLMGSRPPSKKVIAAESSRQRAREKKAQDDLIMINEQKRLAWLAQVRREELEKSEKTKEDDAWDAGVNPNEDQGDENREEHDRESLDMADNNKIGH